MSTHGRQMRDSTTTRVRDRVLIMGIGNTLLQDDGVGVLVTEHLQMRFGQDERYRFVDGGTLGLSLLPEIEDNASLIVIDAAEIGEPPGTVRTFLNADMDRQLSGRKSTVHELALSDLLAAAELNGRKPDQRALIAIQPGSTEWGLEPTPDVQTAVPDAVRLAQDLAEKWGA